MTPQELTQKIAQRLEQWQKAQENQMSGYEYEKSFTELWQQLGKEVFQSSLGEEQYNKNYKKKSRAAGSP
jgi:hypothetical protein